MFTQIAHITLLVRDYDEAINFYKSKLGFILLENTELTPEKRWVRMAPPGGGAALLLAKAKDENQLAQIGHQSGGRVFLFLHTNDFDKDFALLQRNEVTIIRQPSTENYGKVCVFADCYGNLWDLVEPIDPTNVH